jgi:hypothetical protein
VAPPAAELQARSIAFVAILVVAAAPAARAAYFRAFRSRAPPALA